MYVWLHWLPSLQVVGHSPPQSPLSQSLVPYIPIMVQLMAVADAISSPAQSVTRHRHSSLVTVDYEVLYLSVH